MTAITSAGRRRPGPEQPRRRRYPDGVLTRFRHLSDVYRSTVAEDASSRHAATTDTGLSPSTPGTNALLGNGTGKLGAAAAPRRPGRMPAAAVVVGGGAAAAIVNPSNGNGALMLIVIGLALAVAAMLSVEQRWMLLLGLPFLGLGGGVGAAQLIPFLQTHLTTTILVAVGASLIAADTLAFPGRASAASLAVLAIAAGLIGLALAPPSAAAVVPGWTFGAAVALFGVAIAAAGRRRPWPQLDAPRDAPVASTRPHPLMAFAPGALLFAGGVGASLVAGWHHNLYEVVAALGVAYLVPGIITRRPRWAESGLLYSALGGMLVATDVLPAATAYLYGLVFAAIGTAMLLLQILSLGRIGGVGRSLITIGAFFLVLSVLPDAPPATLLVRNVGLLIPLLPALSGVRTLVQAWRGGAGRASGLAG